jgi:hypothetical protein
VLLPALAFVALGDDPAEAVARIPPSAGVGQLVGPEGRSLVLAPAANLRRWAGSYLGLGKPPATGRRPRTNLRGLATAVGFAETRGSFQQRLLYERLAPAVIPRSARRDLQPPAFLHLDPDERFPRVTVRGPAEGTAGLFGPFRDRRAAEKARAALHRTFPLRPCDYVFEPEPTLPLGVGCLYAQVRSCAAPCLSRVSEEEYRALAVRAGAWLADPRARAEESTAVSPAVAAAGAQALVLDVGRVEIGLYPVRAGRVIEATAVTTTPGELEEATARLEWPEATGPEDWPWLTAWLRGPKGRASYLIVRDPADRGGILTAVRAALAPRFAAPSGGDNVGTSRGRS